VTAIGTRSAALGRPRVWRGQFLRRRICFLLSHMRTLINVACLFLFGLLVACGPASCSSDVTPVKQADYRTKIVGDWQGRVGDENETISFGADGRFVCQVRRSGFISNTLGQGVTGTIRGTWTLDGRTISLRVSSAEDARLVNGATTSTIEEFKPSELVSKSDNGERATFVRL
jgi:uncharacterized protein (TIGR03066 family)